MLTQNQFCAILKVWGKKRGIPMISKEEFLKNDILPYYNVTLAFDDDESNKNMFLKNGITVLQPYSIDVYNLINAE